MNQHLHEIRKIYLFSGTWVFMLFVPILVPYCHSLGLGMQEVFLLQVLFGAVSALFEVPSGYISDIFGRKRSLIFGSLLYGLGMTLLWRADSFWELAAFEALLGIAMSLVSGTDIAMLYDWVTSETRAASTQILSQHQLTQVVFEAIAALLCSLLVLGSFQHVLVAQMLVGWVPLLVAFTLKEPTYAKLDKSQPRENFRLVMAHIFKGDPLLRQVFLNYIFWSLSTYMAVWIYQKQWENLGIPIAWFGVIWGCYNLAIGVIGRQVPRLEKRFGAVPLLWAMGTFPVIGYVGLALLTGWAGVLVALFFHVCRAIVQILLRDALNWRTPGAFRATVNSLVQLGFRLGFTVLGPLTGWGIDRFGMSPVLLGLAAFFALVGWPLLIPLSRSAKEVDATRNTAPS